MNNAATEPITIKHRWTNAALFASPTAKTIAEALAEAIKAGANLADANLADANLAGANLAGAYLADANLAGANLAGAYLADADLADADLARANLARADLADANLADANLADANLAGAYLARANLADANLAGADLADAYLADADLADAYLADAYLARANLAGARGITPEQVKAGTERQLPEVPVIPNIHQTLLEAVTKQGCRLDMSQWHSCETTHCRAGWIITLAGDAGRVLEKEVGPARAASLIYRKSDPGCRIPHWYASNDRALDDIKVCAEREAYTST